MTSGARKEARTRLGLAWALGGRTEHSMISAYVFGCVLMVVPIIVEIIFFARTWPPGEWRQTAFSIFPAAVSWPAFSPAIREVMYSPSCYRATLQDEGLSPAQRAFVSEYARFKEEVGLGGQLPGAVRLGFSYAALYFGMVVGSSLSVVEAFPSLGDWTALLWLVVVVSLSVSCWLFYLRRQKGLLRLAKDKGFQLTELRNQLHQSRGTGGGRQWSSKSRTR